MYVIQEAFFTDVTFMKEWKMKKSDKNEELEKQDPMTLW
jgi:hypothetical protein